MNEIPEDLSALLKRDFKVTTHFKGGETKGLKILKDYLKDK